MDEVCSNGMHSAYNCVLFTSLAFWYPSAARGKYYTFHWVCHCHFFTLSVIKCSPSEVRSRKGIITSGILGDRLDLT